MLRLGASAPSLPPNVKGASRGNIYVTLEDLHWKPNVRLPFAGNSVDARLIWWGESTSTVVRIDCRKNVPKTPQTITYSINTSAKLFQQYISSAEPFRIKISSGISNVQIGSVCIRLPGKFVQFLAGNSSNPKIVTKATHHIANTKHIPIGDIVVTFGMTITERNRPTIVPTIMLDSNRSGTASSRRSVDFSSKFAADAISCLNASDSNEIRATKAKSLTKDCATEPTSCQPSSKSYNFLTGRHMSKQQELEALQELKVLSPTNSLIESLSEHILGGLQSSKENCRPLETNVYSKIDSIKVNVLDLSLTRAGIREVSAAIRGYLATDVTFIVECKLNTISSDANSLPNARRCKWKNDFDVIRVTSGCLSDFTSKIEFNKEAIRPIDIPMVDTPSNAVTFKIWFRQLGEKQSQTFGIAVVRVRDIVKSTNFRYVAKCSVTIGDIVLGTLFVRLELGTRGLHFGRDFIEAISLNKENLLDGDDIGIISVGRDHRQTTSKMTRPRVCVHDTNEVTESSQTTKENQKPVEPVAIDSRRELSARHMFKNNEKNDHLVNVENRFSADDHATLLHGLIYIGSIFHLKPHSARTIDTYIVIRAFWSDSAITTGASVNDVFNYLEMFPVMCNDEFFDRTRNQCLDLEMWQRNPNERSTEQLIGTTSVPLHQFYVAFRDAAVLNHLSKVKLPVISIDGWTTIVSPITSTPVAKLQVLLAIGTEDQLTYLKASRGLAFGSLSEAEIFKNKLSIPHPFAQPPPTVHSATVINNAATQTNFRTTQSDAGIQTNVDKVQQQLNSSGDNVAVDRQAALATMLNNFIDNLAARLPPERNQNAAEISPVEQLPVDKSCNVTSPLSAHQTAPSPGSNVQIRRTSDLLDALQRALMCPPSGSFSVAGSSMPLLDAQGNNSEDSHKTNPDSAPDGDVTAQSQQQSQSEFNCAGPFSTASPHFQVLIEIENALHLSKIFIRINKKCGKQRGGSASSMGTVSTGGITSRCQSSNKSVPQSTTTVYRGVTEVEPSTYVTFEATGPPTSIVQSHEGPVYTTNVIEKSCNPQWNKRFEVFLPVDLMTCDEKRFVLKVWRKASTDLPQARLLPNPIEDSLIGFTAIDLSVLLLGMPTISGWYNIVDFSGRIHGQIKVNIQPMEDLSPYRPTTSAAVQLQAPASVPTYAQQMASAQNAMLPLSIDTTFDANRDTVLSRTLKRKFTELEEITQRLRARLFDVTGDDNIDPDDEFENDLNTNPEEDEDDDGQRLLLPEGQNGNFDFDWFRTADQPTTTTGTFEGRANEFQCTMAAANGAATMPLTVVPVSLATADINWERILEEHEIDEVINPTILPRLLNPSIPVSTSEESTPRLMATTIRAQPIDNNDDAINSDTASSLTDQDRIRLISNALQNTNIAADTQEQAIIDEQMERHAPEGHVSTTKEI